MDESSLSNSSSGYKPQRETTSSVPEWADDTESIQVLSTINCDSECPELTDHNEDEARQDASSQPEVVSLLDRLRSPTPSDLVRKRKAQSNPPVYETE